MDAHAMNIIQGRQFPRFPIPTGLSLSLPFPLPTGKPGGRTLSSSSSRTSASSSSLSTSSSSLSSASPSSASSTPVPSSSSTTSSDLTTSTTSSSSSSSIVPSTSTLSTSTATVTAFPDSPTTTPSPSASPSHTTTFLQNKVLSGIVFALAGVIALAILLMITTFALRRKRNKRLIEDAVSFDPVNMGTGRTGYPVTLETGQVNRSRASNSTGRNSNWSNGPEIRNAPAFIDFDPSPRSYLPPSANEASYSYPQQEQGYYSNNQQPYGQSFNWGASSQQVKPYSLSTVEEVDQSRRSRSSSSEIKFAPTAVPPPKQQGRLS